MSDEHDKERRIAELESEVAQLRQRLEPGTAAASPVPTTTLADAGPEQPLGTVSRRKVIALAVTVALLALVAFAAVFTAMSAGFDSLAKKAAKSLLPEAPSGTSSGSSPGSAPPPSGPSVPGL